METIPNKTTFPFNRVLYISFIAFSLYYIFASKNYMDAAATLGIALAFDPFNTEQPWQERPTWQKAWLIIHLAAVAAVFGYGIGLGDK